MKNEHFVILTKRCLLRSYQIGDAALLKEAIDSSLEHLLPWMPWALDEPQTLRQKEELIVTFRNNFLNNKDYVYGIFSPDESRLLGGTGLHPRSGGEDCLEIGYWMRADEINKGIVTEAAQAMCRLAFEHLGVKRLEIRCEKGNARSIRIPLKLGFRLIKENVRYPDGRLIQVYELQKGEMP